MDQVLFSDVNDPSDIEVLAFSPHPDDVEIFAGGTVAQLSSKHIVGLIDLTEGELSSRGDVATRRMEADAAGRALGCVYRENLGIPDGRLTSSDEATHAAVSVLRRCRPSIVLIPWSEARHPDHSGAHALLKRALFLANLVKFAPELGEPISVPFVVMYEMRVEMQFSFLLDISSYLDKKRAAIKCYASQVKSNHGAVQGNPSFLYTELGSQTIESRTQYYGAMIGAAHAEPLALMGPIGVSDVSELCSVLSSTSHYVYPRRG